jgi:hypothetical protein
MHLLLRSVLVVALVGLPTLARAAACDRICLNLILDGYFVALADHDTSRLPLAANVRVTENGLPATIGEGIWKQAGEATYRLDAVDPVLESAASNAVLPENGKAVILFVRLKIADEKVTEIETLVLRPGDGQRAAPEALIDPSPFHLFVPVSLQASRDEMTMAVDAYFDSLDTAGTDAFTPSPISDRARRVENGEWPDAAPQISINDQLRQAQAADRFRVTDRRTVVLDEGRGVILVMGITNRGTPLRRQVLAQFFKIADGMIRDIQVTAYTLDSRAVPGPGWPAPGQ